MSDSSKTSPKQTSSPSIFQVIKAVSASMLGVQSQKNYQADFKTNSVVPFLIVGVVFVVLFILGLVLLVDVILH